MKKIILETAVKLKRISIYQKDYDRVMEWGRFNQAKGDIESPNYKINFPYFLNKLLDKKFHFQTLDMLLPKKISNKTKKCCFCDGIYAIDKTGRSICKCNSEVLK